MTTTELPPAGGQQFPRALRLPDGGPPLPASQLRLFADADGWLELRVSGHAFPSAAPDGSRLRVRFGAAPVAGALALVNAGGGADLRRLVAAAGAGWRTALDARPGARETVPALALLAIADAPRRGALARRLAGWRDAALAAWIRAGDAVELVRAGRTAASVTEKFAEQAGGYAGQAPNAPAAALVEGVRAHCPPGGRVLVAGCGAGQELLALAKGGYRTTGLDLVPAMCAAADATLAAAGFPPDSLCAELSAFAPGERRWDAVLCTPHLLSFVAGRADRIAALRALGAALAPGGTVLLDLRRASGASRRLRALLAWWRGRRAGTPLEWGDAATWRLGDDGAVRASFIHYQSPAELRREARRAGFARVVKSGPVLWALGDWRGA